LRSNPGEGQGNAWPNPETIRSRQLRVNQSDAETKLWNRLRNRQIDGRKFVRQQPIGRYICDFVCREKLVIIEVDGWQHSESARDEVRDRYLRGEGYRVMRFWNNDVLSNIEGVLTVIDETLRESEKHESADPTR
jgi:very-short-patch-repair endonuclease